MDSVCPHGYVYFVDSIYFDRAGLLPLRLEHPISVIEPRDDITAMISRAIDIDDVTKTAKQK
jgi:hypothetical protein